VTYWLIVTSLPSIIQGHIFALLTLMFGLSHGPYYRDGILVLTWRTWFAERYRYSLTIGHCVHMHPRAGELTWAHEMIHVRQAENLNVLGAVVGGLSCIVSWRLGLIIWATSGPLWLVPNYLTGWLRYGNAYYGASHERSAYAQLDHPTPTGTWK
jgi:hypothetical protein